MSEMENQIEKFDPSTLMQGVKDRIKATFVSLIPETEWNALVEKEIDAFFNQTVKVQVTELEKRDSLTSWYGTKYLVVETEQTPFRAIVWQFCKDMTYQTLKDHITKEFFNNSWCPTEKDLSEGMKQMISEIAPTAMAEFFQGILLNQAMSFKGAIQNMKSGQF